MAPAFYVLALAFCCFALGSFGLSTTPKGKNNTESLETQVRQFEVTVTSLKSQFQVQEQKYSAILSSVLSKLAETSYKVTNTTDEFTNVKAELKIAKDQYNSLQDQHDKDMKTNAHLISQLTEKVNSTAAELQNVTMELKYVKDSYKSLQTQHAIVVANMSKNENAITQLSKDANTQKSDFKLKLADLKSNFKTLDAKLVKVKEVNENVTIQLSEEVKLTRDELADVKLELEDVKNNCTLLHDYHTVTVTELIKNAKLMTVLSNEINTTANNVTQIHQDIAVLRTGQNTQNVKWNKVETDLGTLKSDIDNSLKNLTEMTAEINSLKPEVTNIKYVQTAVSNLNSTAISTHNELKQVQSQVQSVAHVQSVLKPEFQDVKSKYQTLQADHSKATLSIKKNTDLIEQLTLAEHSATANLTWARSNILQLKSEWNSQRVKLGKTASDLGSVRSDLDSCFKNLTAVSSEIDILKPEVSKIRYVHTAVEDLNSTIVSTQHDLSHVQSQELSTAHMQSTLKLELQDIKRKYQTLQADHSKASANIKKNADLIKDLTLDGYSTKDNLTWARTNVLQLKSEWNKQNVKLNKAESDLAIVKTNLDNSLKNLTATTLEINSLKPDISKIKSVEAAANNLNSTIASTQSQFHHLLSQATSIAHVQSTLQSNISHMTSSYKTLQAGHSAAMADITKNTNLIRQLKVLANSTNYDVGRIQSDIRNLKSHQNTANAELNKAKSDVALVKSDLDTSLSNLTAITSDLHALKPQVAKITSIQASIRDLKTSYRSTQTGLQHVQTEVRNISAEQASFKTELSTIESSVTKLTNDLAQEIKTGSIYNPSGHKIVSHTAKPNVSHVAFKVEQTAHPVSFPSNRVMRFNNVESNYGEGYSQNTGKFTAPFYGFYLFWFNVVVERRLANVTVSILQDTNLKHLGEQPSPKRIGYAFRRSEAYGGSDTLTAIGVANVPKGKDVWMTASVNGHAVTFNEFSSFGGVLLYKD